MTYKLTQAGADDFYEALLDAHLGLSNEQSALLNARLILLMAQEIGDAKLLVELIAAARQTSELP
jgi:hypothetical protein